MASCPACGSRPIRKDAAKVRYCRRCGSLPPTAPTTHSEPLQ